MDAAPDAEVVTFDHPARVLQIIDGDTIKVRCIGVDQQGKVKLSHREFYDGPIPEDGGRSSRSGGGSSRIRCTSIPSRASVA